MDNAISEHRGETTRLGSFEILRRLARGGMAEIFLARTSGPSGFEKLVVLKKILAKYATRPRFVQLFLEEARLAASLDHPSIAQVYDIGMVDGAYFFTMEHLHGQDVRSILHRAWRTGERFAIEHAVQIARHVASALHCAHEKQRSDGSLLGLVHRDVSPSNIIVTYDGATKLLDFGVAKTAASTVKTRTGTLKGKIAYMSPEQARGASIDRRSDIFSLGIVLWEMVTTQRLYRADNDLATLQLIIHQPPRPPSQVRPDCPPELERIVLRALAQDPGQRYATAEQLVLDLDELAREHKLKQSPSALAAALAQLFAPELAAWREARTRGVPLAEHLNEIGDRTAPVSESDLAALREQLEPSEPEADSVDDEPEADSVDDEPDDSDEEMTEHAAPILEPLSPLAGELDGPGGSLRPSEPSVTIAAPPSLAGGPLVSTLVDPPRPPDIAVEPLVPTLVDPPRPSSSPLSAAPWQSGQPGPPSDPGARPVRPWSIIELPAFDPAVFARHRRIAARVAAALVALVLVLAIAAGRC